MNAGGVFRLNASKYMKFRDEYDTGPRAFADAQPRRTQPTRSGDLHGRPQSPARSAIGAGDHADDGADRGKHQFPSIAEPAQTGAEHRSRPADATENGRQRIVRHVRPSELAQRRARRIGRRAPRADQLGRPVQRFRRLK